MSAQSRRLLTGSALLAMLSFAALAHASQPPVITSVTVNPTTAVVNTDVIMEAHLAGDFNVCKVRVNWGDGTGIPETHIHDYNKPAMGYIHKYTVPGKYVASVLPISGCTGGGRMQVTILPKEGSNPTGGPSTAPLGKLTGLKVSGATATAAALLFKTTDTLSATAEGVNGLACGLAITSNASVAQPVQFVVDGSNPFPVTRKFSNLMPGNHTVTATPVAGPGVPPCQGAPITVNITVK